MILGEKKNTLSTMKWIVFYGSLLVIEEVTNCVAVSYPTGGLQGISLKIMH